MIHYVHYNIEFPLLCMMIYHLVGYFMKTYFYLCVCICACMLVCIHSCSQKGAAGLPGGSDPPDVDAGG